MCGIAGAVSAGGVDPAVLAGATEALAHRGPDGDGYVLFRSGEPLEALSNVRDRPADAVAGLGHRRLSIIDLSGRNAQPFVDSAAGLALVYNGELYNYVELRRELVDRGHRFATTGDTEVVLRAYAEWGGDAVTRFVGMWAFAILDARREQLLLSRDRLGIKPLYLARTRAGLFFASEIKAFAAVPDALGDPDPATVGRYLATGSVESGEATFFSGVRRFPAGCNATVALGPGRDPTPAVSRYWELPTRPLGLSDAEAVDTYRNLLEDAIRIHGRSDVPVGTCLSGGLDSSGIVCVAERLREQAELPRYTHAAFGYCPPRESERPYMEQVAGATGARLHPVTAEAGDFDGAVEMVIAQQDEPFSSSSIVAQWLVFREAARHGVTVMLDGQGPDEVLGGYHQFFGVRARALARGRHPLALARFTAEHRRAYGRSLVTWRDVAAAWVPPAVRGLRRGGPAEVLPVPRPDLVSRELAEAAGDGLLVPSGGTFDDELRRATLEHSLPALLRYEDRNSMAHSIEARVPYLDHRLVELSFALDPGQKIRGDETKWVLREALRGTIPEPVRMRTDKIGFRADPDATWRLAAARRSELLDAGTAYERRWLEPGDVRRLFDTTDRSAQSEMLLWRVLNLKLWLRRHWT